MTDDRAEADFGSAAQLPIPGTPHYLWRQYPCSEPGCAAEHVFATRCWVSGGDGRRGGGRRHGGGGPRTHRR